MKVFFLLPALAGMSMGLQAQTAKEQQAIKSLCGCYEVDFKYAETFAADEEYKFPPRYQVSGLEWVVAVETSPSKFALQHLLVASDTFIIKHWREDWEYEKAGIWKFDHDATWKYTAGNKNDVKGQWQQTVWEVDDAPRYQGSSSWVSSNGKYYWENTTDAPLPRREYTKRKDYNVLQRTNRVVITDSGWVHEQDNKKIIRKNGTPDLYLAEEKGYNIYRKTDDSKCKPAADWWAKHSQFWSTVRQSWEETMKGKNVVHVVPDVDGKRLGQQLAAVESEGLPEKRRKEKITAILNSYVSNKETNVAVVP